MFTLKVDCNMINYETAKYEDYDEKMYFAKIYVYHQNEDDDTVNTLCEFVIDSIDSESEFDPKNKDNNLAITFNGSNGNASVYLKDNKFTIFFSKWGDATAHLQNTFTLTDDENTQFTAELKKFFWKP